jgi:hypothetical protein
MPPRHLLSLFLLALAAAPDASAQFQWRDANGRMVYSDMPPPASVAPASVLRAPGKAAPSSSAEGQFGSDTPARAPSSAHTAAPARAAAVTAADRELEFRKRRMEKAEADRKAAEASVQAQRKAAACADSRSEIRALESGLRMSRVNEKGERETLDDKQRAGRLDAARAGAKEACQG